MGVDAGAFTCAIYTPQKHSMVTMGHVQYESEIEHEIKFSQIEAFRFPTQVMTAHSVKSWTAL